MGGGLSLKTILHHIKIPRFNVAYFQFVLTTVSLSQVRSCFADCNSASLASLATLHCSACMHGNTREVTTQSSPLKSIHFQRFLQISVLR